MKRIATLALCAALIGTAACSGRSGPQFDRSDVENITNNVYVIAQEGEFSPAQS